MPNELFPGAVALPRRTLLKAAGAAALALGAAPILAGCGTKQTIGAGGGTPQQGGRLTLGTLTGGQAETLDPGRSNLMPDILRICNLYDNLYVRGADGKPQSSLAKSAEPNADATVWTFRLQDGVTWHDGKPLTADDLLWTIQSWRSEDNYGVATMEPFIDYNSVKKLDDLTVQVPLLVGCNEFPSLTTMAQFAVVQNGSAPGSFVGTGPFVYKSFQAGSSSVFTANKDYWVHPPYVDELVVDSSFQDDTARVNALLSGVVDLAPAMPTTLAKANESAGTVYILNSPGPTFQAFTMNCEIAPFRDLRVREALKLLVNREAMLSSALNGYGTVGNDLTPAGTEFFASDLARNYDPDKARSLLKAAGQENLRFAVDTSNAVAGMFESATLFQQQAKAVGVTVDINRIDTAAYFTQDAGWLNYPFGQTFWQSPISSLTQFAMTALYTRSLYPETRWATPDSDRLLFDAMSETDQSRAAEKWNAFQRLQFDTGGYIVWANVNYVDGATSRVNGIEASPAGYLGGGRLHDAWVSA